LPTEFDDFYTAQQLRPATMRSI